MSPEELEVIRRQVADATGQQRVRLDELRSDVRALVPRSLNLRHANAVSFVACEVSTSRLAFDPVEVFLIRVVDSLPHGGSPRVQATSRESDLSLLSETHFEDDTALGRLMADLEVPREQGLNGLSHMLPKPGQDVDHRSPSWPGVYRELLFWAELYQRVTRPSETTRLIVLEGQLRSKVFAGTCFMRLFEKVRDACLPGQNRGPTYLAAVGRWNNVLARYSLALALEGTLHREEPCYVAIPRSMEAKASRWTRDLRGWEDWTRPTKAGEEPPRFVAGDLYLVRFGDRRGDPVWPVDLFSAQANTPQKADEILGYLQADALEGFPRLHYPRSLQIAQERAKLDEFEVQLLDDIMADAVRDQLPAQEKSILDELKLRARTWRAE